MGIFGKDRELFKPEYNKNQYTIKSSQSDSYQSDSNKEVTLEENISSRCRIDNLNKIWVKNFIIITLLPFLFIAGIDLLEENNSSSYMVLTAIALFFIIYPGIVLQNMIMKDKLINNYVIRKTKFYEILYKKLSETYTVSAEYSHKIEEYIKIFPKKYKLNTALKEIIGIILCFIFFMVCIIFFIGFFITKSLEKYYPNNSYQAIIIIIVISGILLILAYKYLIVNPLKRKNEIWYEISLFEKNVTDIFQQLIPESNKNKKQVNYPVDKTLKQPFALYFIVSIITGFFFIIWDYQMVMAKQKYLSKAYLVEDYFAGLV